MKISFIAILACSVVLIACDASPNNKGLVNAAVFETAVTEAVVRQVVNETGEELDVEVPYCVVVGPQLQGTSAKFAERFKDTGKSFVLEGDLTLDVGTKATMVKGALTSPIVIHVIELSERADGTDVKVAWNYRRDVVGKLYRVSGDPLAVAEVDVLREERFVSARSK